MISASTVITLPFNQLMLSPKNVRSTGTARGIGELAKSIMAQGLLQNLVVTASQPHSVVAGGRRYRALAMLVEDGQIPADYAVPVKLVHEDDSTCASLVENVARETMHPADEYAAFARLTAEGWTIDRIADAFSVTALFVERRLRLSEAAPALMVEYKNDQITTDQLIALCSTEDHERQVEVWNRLRKASWQSTPEALRKAVLGSEIDASEDPRIGFIGGVAAYVEAGGIVRRDLFSEDGSGGIIEADERAIRSTGCAAAGAARRASARRRVELGRGLAEPRHDSTGALRSGTAIGGTAAGRGSGTNRCIDR